MQSAPAQVSPANALTVTELLLLLLPPLCLSFHVLHLLLLLRASTHTLLPHHRLAPHHNSPPTATVQPSARQPCSSCSGWKQACVEVLPSLACGPCCCSRGACSTGSSRRMLLLLLRLGVLCWG